MKQLLKKAALLCAASILMSTPVFAETCFPGWIKVKNPDTKKLECRQPTPDEGWQLLLNGNKRYALGYNGYLDANSNKKQRETLSAGQKPYAVVLTCSDSRVPPEILFNKALGEIFVIRVAGNIVSPHELGSIDYALEHLESNLIVVLGHEKCGAVKATYDAYPAHYDTADVVLGNIASLTESIYPAVDAVVNPSALESPPAKPIDLVEQAAQVEECVLENIKQVGESLEVKSTIVKEAKEGILEYTHKDANGTSVKVPMKNPLKIKYAKYDLNTGLVTDETPPQIPVP
jgi:carbonic anhydrase